MEPWGRWLVGTVEVVVVVLLLIGRTAAYGAVLALVLMSGALGTHLFKLGIVYSGDASLFLLALVVFVAAGIVVPSAGMPWAGRRIRGSGAIVAPKFPEMVQSARSR